MHIILSKSVFSCVDEISICFPVTTQTCRLIRSVKKAASGPSTISSIMSSWRELFSSPAELRGWSTGRIDNSTQFVTETSLHRTRWHYSINFSGILCYFCSHLKIKNYILRFLDTFLVSTLNQWFVLYSMKGIK